MGLDHELRPACAKEFGSIQKSLEFHKEWRDEARQSLGLIQREVEKLTGNGNRGRIDSISDDLHEIKTMLVSHIRWGETENTATHAILESHSAKITRLESRIYKVAVGAAALAAVFVPLAKAIADKLL